MDDVTITVTDTITVYPSTWPLQTDVVLPLSHLDNDRNLHVTFRYIRAYASTTDPFDPFNVITDSLSEALLYYYPFTGTLRRRVDSDRLELTCAAGRGVPVLKAIASVSLDSVSYIDDPGAPFVEKLVPDPDPIERLNRPFILQVTRFECGGYCLGAAIHHSLNDGLGGAMFFNSMAELARGSTRVSVEPVWERVKLLGPRDPPSVGVPLEEVLQLGEDVVSYGERTGPVVKVRFDVKDEWLDRLKELLLDQSGKSFTVFEALGAFIWRAKVKAMKIPSDEKVKFVYSLNIRKILNPPLPVGYWGNGCVPMYVHLTVQDLLCQPLWMTSEFIKKSKMGATNEYVRSYIDFQELNYRDGIGAGKWVTAFTDWRHLGHSTVDFGSGGPVNVVPISRNLLGSVEPCFFLPYSSAIKGMKKDGFKILINLRESALIGFKEEMAKLSNMELGVGDL